VLIWVDGNDIEWQKERNKYAGKNPEDVSPHLFRDWDNLKYWFRGVEKYAPWVNKVYFVTNGQKPEWLNLDCEKLVWVKHEEYIPKEYLPTFNSHTIELNLHRIKGLSEHFVYFNDDTFLVSNTKKEDFFKKGKPRYVAGFEVVRSSNKVFGGVLWSDMYLLNKYFTTSSVFKGNRLKWFSCKNGFKNNIKTFLLSIYNKPPCFLTTHMPNPMLKSTFEKLWNDEKEILNETSKCKFRSADNVNQYVFSWYNLASGNFENSNIKNCHYYNPKSEIEAIKSDMRLHKYKMICINDPEDLPNFEKTKNEVIEAFDRILPDKSSYEL
jgi:hypothetical protein